MHLKRAVPSLIAVGAPLRAVSLHAASFGKDANNVHVESNIRTPNGNSIIAYRPASNGQLTQVQESPFVTGGSGIQFTGVNDDTPDSDQDIITNPDHTLPFAVNSG